MGDDVSVSRPSAQEKIKQKPSSIKTFGTCIHSVCKFLVEHPESDANVDGIHGDILSFLCNVFAATSYQWIGFKVSIMKSEVGGDFRDYITEGEVNFMCIYEWEMFKKTGDPLHLKRRCMWSWYFAFGCRPFTLCNVECEDIHWEDTEYAYGGPRWQLQVMLLFKDGAGRSLYGKTKQPRNLCARRDLPAMCPHHAYACWWAFRVKADGGPTGKLFQYEGICAPPPAPQCAQY